MTACCRAAAGDTLRSVHSLPQDLAAACSADARCIGFSAFPNGSDALAGSPMGYLLGGDSVRSLDTSWAYLNPRAVLYVNSSTGATPSPAPPAPPSPPPTSPPADKGPPLPGQQQAGFQTASDEAGSGQGGMGVGAALGAAATASFALSYPIGDLKQWNASDAAAAGGQCRAGHLCK